MVLIHGPHGSINWNYTSTFLRNNYSDFLRAMHNMPLPQRAQEDWRDYGAGSEPTFICLNCNRVLPLALGEVDHKVAHSTLLARIDAAANDITLHGTSYSFPQNGVVRTISVADGFAAVRRFTIKQDGLFYLASVLAPAQPAPAIPGRQMVIPFYATGTPLSVVARNDVVNLQLLCAYCNRSKGNR